MMIADNLTPAQRRKIVLETAKADNLAVSKTWNLGGKGFNFGIYTQVHRGGRPSKKRKAVLSDLPVEVFATSKGT